MSTPAGTLLMRPPSRLPAQAAAGATARPTAGAAPRAALARAQSEPAVPRRRRRHPPHPAPAPSRLTFVAFFPFPRWSNTSSIGGIMSDDCTVNPDFCTWNRVHMAYCEPCRAPPPPAAAATTAPHPIRPSSLSLPTGDGNSFSGNRDEPIVYNGDKVHPDPDRRRRGLLPRPASLIPAPLIFVVNRFTFVDAASSTPPSGPAAALRFRLDPPCVPSSPLTRLAAVCLLPHPQHADEARPVQRQRGLSHGLQRRRPCHLPPRR